MSMPEILAVVRKIQFSKIGGHRGITLVALVVTTIFSYDENIKSSNNKVSSYKQFSKNHKFSNI